MAKSKFLKNTFRKITKSPIFMSCVSFIMFIYANIVWKSTKWEFHGKDKLFKTWEKDGIILVGWHGRAPMMPLMANFVDLKKRPMKALVSLHNDGRLIAGFLQKFGIGIIGGSSNNNAKGAAINLMKSLQNGESITIIPDGPRGPRMKMSMSPIYYAHKTGKPIFTLTYSINKAKVIEKAWDKMLVPFPFGKGVYYISEPFYVPKDVSDQDFEKYRQELEDLINKDTQKADKQMGLSPILPETEKKKKRYKN